MKIYFLGTNGWCDTDLGNTLCVLVETKKAYIVFDAGNGLFKLDKYIKDKRPIYLFLSHFHLDHIIGLHGLNKFNFPQGINVFGPKGIKEMFRLIINAPYSKPINKLKTRIRVSEIDGDSRFPFDIEFRKLIHTTQCYGYRLCADNKSIAFCTDTGPCKGVDMLAKNADLLIAECSLPPGKIDMSWPHLNPQQAARIARDLKVKKLALVHFDAGAYPGLKQRIKAGIAANKIFKPTIISRDNLRIDV
jgi:ribonuclease BN (tRNA processing enzyme)